MHPGDTSNSYHPKADFQLTTFSMEVPSAMSLDDFTMTGSMRWPVCLLQSESLNPGMPPAYKSSGAVTLGSLTARSTPHSYEIVVVRLTGAH